MVEYALITKFMERLSQVRKFSDISHQLLQYYLRDSDHEQADKQCRFTLAPYSDLRIYS